MKPRKVKLICHLKSPGSADVQYFSTTCRQRLRWMKKVGYTFSGISILNINKDARFLTFQDQVGLDYFFPEAIILKIWQK
jgi:hypothetical protein